MANETTTETPSHVLVVDDEEADLYALAKMLRDGGFEVSTARNYFDALEALDGADTVIHVLVTDIVLKLGNGFSLARIARLHRPGLKTVYITAYDDVPTAEAVGPVLRKPVAEGDLIATVLSVLAAEDEGGDL